MSAASLSLYIGGVASPPASDMDLDSLWRLCCIEYCINVDGVDDDFEEEDIKEEVDEVLENDCDELTGSDFGGVNSFVDDKDSASSLFCRDDEDFVVDFR